jgi:hypothetical protein
MVTMLVTEDNEVSDVSSANDSLIMQCVKVLSLL